MAKVHSGDRPLLVTTADIELRPDGWERFEKAVDAAAKSGPKHRREPTPKTKERPASKRPV
jgi:hypothetical protein